MIQLYSNDDSVGIHYNLQAHTNYRLFAINFKSIPIGQLRRFVSADIARGSTVTRRSESSCAA